MQTARGTVVAPRVFQHPTANQRSNSNRNDRYKELVREEKTQKDGGLWSKHYNPTTLQLQHQPPPSPASPLLPPPPPQPQQQPQASSPSSAQQQQQGSCPQGWQTLMRGILRVMAFLGDHLQAKWRIVPAHQREEWDDAVRNMSMALGMDQTERLVVENALLVWFPLVFIAPIIVPTAVRPSAGGGVRACLAQKMLELLQMEQASALSRGLLPSDIADFFTDAHQYFARQTDAAAAAQQPQQPQQQQQQPAPAMTAAVDPVATVQQLVDNHPHHHPPTLTAAQVQAAKDRLAQHLAGRHVPHVPMDSPCITLSLCRPSAQPRLRELTMVVATSADGGGTAGQQGGATGGGPSGGLPYQQPQQGQQVPAAAVGHPAADNDGAADYYMVPPLPGSLRVRLKKRLLFQNRKGYIYFLVGRRVKCSPGTQRSGIYIGAHHFILWAMHGWPQNGRMQYPTHLEPRPRKAAKQPVHDPLTYKPIAMHICSNPACINPLHIFYGDHSNNAKAVQCSLQAHTRIVANSSIFHQFSMGLARRDPTKDFSNTPVQAASSLLTPSAT